MSSILILSELSLQKQTVYFIVGFIYKGGIVASSHVYQREYFSTFYSVFSVFALKKVLRNDETVEVKQKR